MQNGITSSYITTVESGSSTKIKMISGSITPVSTSPSSSRKMFSLEELRKKFNTTEGSPHFSACVTNGDTDAQDAHIDGTSWSNGSLYAVLDRSVSGAVRINYVIFCWE